MRTRTVDPTELYRTPPLLVTNGTHAGWSYWVCRFDKFPDPLVEAWISQPYTTHCVWMPGATPGMVKAWIEGLPIPAPRKSRATQSESGGAANTVRDPGHNENEVRHA